MPGKAVFGNRALLLELWPGESTEIQPRTGNLSRLRAAAFSCLYAAFRLPDPFAPLGPRMISKNAVQFPSGYGYPQKALCGGIPRCGLGAVGAVLEPFRGHFSPKIDMVSKKLTFEIPPRRASGGFDF